MNDELYVDKQRVLDNFSRYHATGIFVRAEHDGKWDAYDIAELTKESLLRWLRSRDGDNKWAEDCVGILLGHGHLHEPS